MTLSAKLRLLRGLDEIIADVREATAAIQRDDYDAAIAKFASAKKTIEQHAAELRAA